MHINISRRDSYDQPALSLNDIQVLRIEPDGERFYYR